MSESMIKEMTSVFRWRPCGGKWSEYESVKTAERGEGWVRVNGTLFDSSYEVEFVAELSES